MCSTDSESFANNPTEKVPVQPGAAHPFPAAVAGWTPPSPRELEECFPGFQIETMIGMGGMGAVYRGLQLSLQRYVAIKILPPHFAEDPEFRHRFQREAQSLAKLQHANIVGVYDFGSAGQYLYFVMEYVDGLDLGRLIHHGEVPYRDALHVMQQVCDALQYAHDEGIIHRDIKPSNILVDRRGRVKVADFGLARALGDTAAGPAVTLTGRVMGTPGYMAPEQCSGQKVDHRSDLYSLGVMFYEMLTGTIPRGVFPAPSTKVSVNPQIDEIVSRALQSDPASRYQTASEIKKDISSTSLAAASPAAEAVGKSGPAGRHSVVRRVLSFGAGLAVVAAGLFFWLTRGGDGHDLAENGMVAVASSLVETKAAVPPGVPDLLYGVLDWNAPIVEEDVAGWEVVWRADLDPAHVKGALILRPHQATLEPFLKKLARDMVAITPPMPFVLVRKGDRLLSLNVIESTVSSVLIEVARDLWTAACAMAIENQPDLISAVTAETDAASGRTHWKGMLKAMTAAEVHARAGSNGKRKERAVKNLDTLKALSAAEPAPLPELWAAGKAPASSIRVHADGSVEFRTTLATEKDKFVERTVTLTPGESGGGVRVKILPEPGAAVQDSFEGVLKPLEKLPAGLEDKLPK